MVGRCANPECGIPFRYYRDGKLFRFEVSAHSTALGSDQKRRPVAELRIFGSVALVPRR